MRRLIVREWKHLSVWCRNGLSGKAAWALRWVYHCAFYQLSLTVWMEAAAELERLWSFYIRVATGQIDERAWGMFRCFIIQTAINTKGNTVTKKEKENQSNAIKCLLVSGCSFVPRRSYNAALVSLLFTCTSWCDATAAALCLPCLLTRHFYLDLLQYALGI